MGAGGLQGLVVRPVASLTKRLRAAPRAVPQGRDFSLGGERHLEPMTEGAAVGDNLPLSELDAALILVAPGAEAGAT